MPYCRHQGQTLLELVIAMGLGLFLLSIILATFQSVTLTTHYVDSLIQIQETLRTFYYLLEQDLRQPEIQVLDPSMIPNNISTRFAKGTSALLLQSAKHKIIYFVTSKNSDYELHRKDLSESLYNADAIAIGINKFEIEYGAFHNQQLAFYKANAIGNWKEVKLIKILLQLQSSNLLNGKEAMKKDISFIVGIP